MQGRGYFRSSGRWAIKANWMNSVNVNYSIQNLKNKKMSDWKNLQKQALGGYKKVQLKKDFNFEVQYAKNVEGKPPMMVEYKLTEGVAEYIEKCGVNWFFVNFGEKYLIK